MTQWRKHITLLLLLMTTAFLQAANRLTVLVAVEGLTEYGVNRYWDQTFDNSMKFEHKVYGGTESLVTLLTGTNPIMHGITHDLRYDIATHKIVGTLADRKQAGIGTTETLSPVNILAPTITDMLKLGSRLNKVYAVGLKGKYTIALAGHNANAALWLNENNLQWAASPYYSEGLPQAADKMNVNKEIEQRSMELWRPMRDSLQKYEFVSEKEETDHGFAYYANSRDRNGIPYFSRTPLANEAVLDMALKLQAEHKLGVYTSDMLCLQLTTATLASNGDRITTAEQEDMYLRLYDQLRNFMDSLNVNYGGRVTLIVTGMPYRGEDPSRLEKQHLSHGDFNIERAAALAGTYLMAIYGHQKWIEGSHCNGLIINRDKLIEQKIDYSEFSRQVARFLENFEGVNHAYTASQIMTSCSDNEELSLLRNSLCSGFAGDVYITLQKGWRITNNNTVVDNYACNYASVPVVVFDNNRYQSISVAKATDLAPQICRLINIQYIP